MDYYCLWPFKVKGQPMTSNRLTFLLCFTNVFVSFWQWPWLFKPFAAKSQRGRFSLPELQEVKPLLFILKKKEKQVYPLNRLTISDNVRQTHTQSVNHAKIHDTGSMVSERRNTSKTVQPQPHHWAPIVITKGKIESVSNSLSWKSRIDMVSAKRIKNRGATDDACGG